MLMTQILKRYGLIYSLAVHAASTLANAQKFVQVKVQTVPGYAKGLSDGMPKVISQEGVGGCVCETVASASCWLSMKDTQHMQCDKYLPSFLSCWLCADHLQHLDRPFH